MSAQGAETRMRKEEEDGAFFKTAVQLHTRTQAHTEGEKMSGQNSIVFLCACPVVPLFVSTWSGMPGGRVS